MTTFAGQSDKVRDLQDTVERGVWGTLTYTANGALADIRGTGTLDQEVPVLNTGYSFNLPANSNAEMLMLSLGSDPYDKVAIPTIPRDAQHAWPAGTGGVQHPTNPERRLEFGENGTWLKDGTYYFGDGEKTITLEISGSNASLITTGNLAIRSGGDLNLEASGDINLTSNGLKHNGTNVGDDHRHSGVTSGSSSTGSPI